MCQDIIMFFFEKGFTTVDGHTIRINKLRLVVYQIFYKDFETSQVALSDLLDF